MFYRCVIIKTYTKKFTNHYQKTEEFTFMDEVTFTKVRSLLPVMDEGANKDGKRYVLKRHKQSRLVLLSFKDYQKLVAAASNGTVSSDSITHPDFNN